MTESPNKLNGWGSNTIKGIVIHYTASESAKGSINWLMNPASKASAHVIIDHEGIITNIVSESNRSWHAGSSSWGGINGCNNFMLGIELVNVGKLTQKIENNKEIFVTAYSNKFKGTKEYDSVTKSYYEVFYDPQIKSLLGLLDTWVEKYKIPQSWIVGHSHVAPDRKTDPGPLFPWTIIDTHFAETKNEAIADAKSLQSHIERLGYELGEIDGMPGLNTKAALTSLVNNYKLLKRIESLVSYKGNDISDIKNARKISNILRTIPWKGYIP